MKRFNEMIKKAILSLVLVSIGLVWNGTCQPLAAQTDSTLVAVDDYVYVSAASVTIAVLSNDILPALGASIVSVGCGPSYGTAFINSCRSDCLFV